MTSYFEIHGCPNRKQKKENIYLTVPVEKQQRKRKTGERKWKANEETSSSLQGPKTGRLVLTKFK